MASMAFTPVKTDMVGNIKVHSAHHCSQSSKDLTDTSGQKIRDRQLAAPAESETLQVLVINDLKTKQKTASGGLLWLVRYTSPFSPLAQSTCPALTPDNPFVAVKISTR